MPTEAAVTYNFLCIVEKALHASVIKFYGLHKYRREKKEISAPKILKVTIPYKKSTFTKNYLNSVNKVYNIKIVAIRIYKYVCRVELYIL